LKRVVISVARFAFVLACAFTLVCALTPPEAHPLQMLPWEKANHLLAFFVLSILAAVAAPRTRLLVLGALLVALGGAIELLQGLPIVHRDPAIGDVGIDAIAIAVALATVAFFRSA
jgi:hypothetical protein